MAEEGKVNKILLGVLLTINGIRALISNITTEFSCSAVFIKLPLPAKAAAYGNLGIPILCSSNSLRVLQRPYTWLHPSFQIICEQTENVWLFPRTKWHFSWEPTAEPKCAATSGSLVNRALRRPWRVRRFSKGR